MREWVRRWFCPDDRPVGLDARPADLDRVDDRLDTLEREQAALEIRLRLLERQADPRGVWGAQHGRE